MPNATLGLCISTHLRFEMSLFDSLDMQWRKLKFSTPPMSSIISNNINHQCLQAKLVWPSKSKRITGTHSMFQGFPQMTSQTNCNMFLMSLKQKTVTYKRQNVNDTRMTFSTSNSHFNDRLKQFIDMC